MMQKFTKVIILLLITVGAVFGGLEQSVLWEKSVAQGTMPGWFDTSDFTRGFSYGSVGGNDRLFVVSRNGGNFIYVLDAASGDSVGRLDNTGISGGTYNVSDVGVSSDGKIYVCNLALNTTFRVYAYDDEADTPTEVIAYLHDPGRFGDKITVQGSVTDNTLQIFAPSATTNELLVFTTSDQGATFSCDTIDITQTGGSASVGPLPSGDFYWNGSGNSVYKFSPTGSELGSVPGEVVATGSNAIRYMTATGNYEYFVTFQYGTGNQNARVVRTLTSTPSNAETFSITPPLGDNANVNGAGDVSVKNNGDGTYDVFVLSTNNGLGAYRFQFPVPAADPVNMSLNGAIYVGDVDFLQNDHATRGMAFNQATNHILIASRTGGAFIYVIDEGVVVDTLDMTDVSGGTYPLNKVVCDEAGVIYACNLALAPSNTFKIYRWADEQATPTLAFESEAVTQRTGDSFALSGSGTETVIYASGSASNQIDVFTTADGSSFVAETPISIEAGTARGGISPVTTGTGSELWINGSGTTVRKVNASGSVLVDISGGTIASSWMNVRYMEATTGARLLAVNSNNVEGDRRKLQVWDLSDSETSPVLWGTGELWNIEQSNVNGVGELDFVNRGSTIELLQLVTNNGAASWELQVPQHRALETIAEVKIDENMDLQPDRLGDTVRVRGVVTTPNYGSHTQYYFQDATGGLTLYSGTFDFILDYGDQIEVVGEITYYRGLTEIEPIDGTSVTVLSENNEVTPLSVMITDVGQENEQLLVRLDSVYIADPSLWPPAGSQGYSDEIFITNGVDSVGIFIDRDSDLDGWTPPQGWMHLIAISDQYTSASDIHDDGYSLRGTFREHFIDLQPIVSITPENLSFGEVAINGQKTLDVKFYNEGGTLVQIDSIVFDTDYFSTTIGDTLIQGGDSVMIPVTFTSMMEDPVEDEMIIYTQVSSYTISLSGSGYLYWPLSWRVHADSTSSQWFYIAGVMQDMVRGIAYNKINDHIYAVSRVGGTFIYALDGATGDTLKQLNTDGISGGTYHINLVACTEDGQLVVGNLAAWGGQVFRLYHYADEDDTPTMIYDGTYDDFGGRVGDALAVSGSGTNLTVFFSGSNNTNIHRLVTTDGINFSLADDVPLPEANAARYGIAPVGDSEYLFVNGPGVAPRYMKTDGTVLHTFDTATIPSGTNINYFEINVPAGTRRFVGITNGWSSGTTVVELLGDPGDGLCNEVAALEAPTDNYSTNANLNATGLAVYSSIHNSVIELITNNGISSYSMDIAVDDAIKDSVVSINDSEDRLPLVYKLSQNYPNPFNPTTTIELSLPKANDVLLEVYNMLGQKVFTIHNGKMNAGLHKFEFDASRFASGVYFYRVQAGSFIANKKMILLK